MANVFRVIYDISVTLGRESADWPDFPPYSREVIARIEKGQPCEMSKLVMIDHSGTHIDTPAHFIANGKTLDEYSLEKWILPAQVVSIEDKEAVRPYELENLDIKPGDALLFKTYNSTSGQCLSRVFSKTFVYVSQEAADFCIEKKVSLVGIDYNSVEMYGDEDFPTHRKLLGNGILILETINLREVPPGRYTVICPPLKIEGAAGSPTRAMLVC